MSEQPSDNVVEQITQGYTFAEPAIDLGVLLHDDQSVPETPVPGTRIRIPLSMLNRHGLVCGATGTGKTKTLQVMAEQISAAGVPVFAADIKGDLSGLASPGTSSEKLLARTASIGQDWAPHAAPVEFFALGGDGLGVPLRATISAFGPLLLSKVMELNDTQESTLSLVFHFADTTGLLLLDLADLRAVLQYLTSDEGKGELTNLGGVSKATVGVILRKLVELQQQGADDFFGEPEFDTADLMRITPDGRGVISLLELPNLFNRPALFSTFLMWLLADLFSELPEVGDIDKPKLVFFFDEAHLLFKDASKAFLDSIAQTVRLIRSKGVGVFFVTQAPTDVPDDVLAQLGSRVQHQLRAHTPKDAKALKATVATFPISSYNLAELLQGLGTGEAVITVMDPDGAPTPVAPARILAPQTLMAPTPANVLEPGIRGSALMAKYGQEIDRDSAYEMLTRKLEQGSRQAEAEAQQQRSQNQRPQQQAPAPRAQQRQTRQPKPEPSVIEQVTNSTAFKQMARTAGREIVRSIFGTGRRR